MKILLVDDERLSLLDLKATVREVLPDAEILTTQTSSEALEMTRHDPADIAFLDIELPEMNGLTLAKNMKELHPQINIIFVTAYSQYALDAFRLYVSGYLMKPVRKEDISRALENLRYPVEYNPSMLYIQCFGKFEVFSRGEVVSFPRRKAKEILAYLVDLRGATASTSELCGILWEDGEKIHNEKAYLRQILSSLRKTLHACGADDVLIQSRDSIAIDINRVECDYYHYLQGDTAVINQFHGEYMRQYSWAEMTIAALERSRLQSK